MTRDAIAARAGPTDRVARFAPGLAKLLRYRRADLPHDLIAGLSVAAVALPVGVAYAQLAGFSPVVGLYASILPLVAYALFGTSRQLIVGPDAATCALIAAAVAPLAGGDAALYLSLSVTLAALAGLFCIGASFLRLGALADFLSKPILVGFLNGISLHILAGQLGKLFGFPVEAQGIVPKLVEVVAKLGQTHWPTLTVGAGTFAVLLLSGRFLPRLPAALVALAVAGLAVALLGLDGAGVAVVGAVPAGLPALKLPSFPLDLLDDLAGAAAGLALVSFSSMMLTARSFAAKNRYEIDADREFAALGAANIAAALSQGFAISGADSRTAMADASGGRTQVTGLVAAATIALVLLFLTEPLRYVPIAALGAVLIKASLSLLDLADAAPALPVRSAGVRPVAPGHLWRHLGGRHRGHRGGRDPGLAALRARQLASKGRGPRPGRGPGWLPLHRPSRGCADRSRPAAVSLQRPAGVLQRALLQTAGTGGHRRGRLGAEVVRARRPAGHSAGRDRIRRARGSVPDPAGQRR